MKLRAFDMAMILLIMISFKRKLSPQPVLWRLNAFYNGYLRVGTSIEGFWNGFGIHANLKRGGALRSNRGGKFLEGSILPGKQRSVVL